MLGIVKWYGINNKVSFKMVKQNNLKILDANDYKWVNFYIYFNSW